MTITEWSLGYGAYQGRQEKRKKSLSTVGVTKAKQNRQAKHFSRLLSSRFMSFPNISKLIKLLLTREPHISQHVMLPGLDRRHLLEEILSRDESDGRDERDHGDANTVVAGVGVVIVHAVLLAVGSLAPALSRDTAHHDHAEQLEKE